jgi:hypothetical protein
VTQDVQQSEGPAQRGSQALTDALRLQNSARERAAAPARKHGKRRKGDVVDLEQMTITRSKGRRWLLVLLVIEAIIAVIAVGVLVAYLVLEGDTLQ